MSNQKLMSIFDGAKTSDKASIKGTDIILKETGTGKVLFRGKNKVLVSGSEFNAMKDFNFSELERFDDGDFLDTIKSYDEALSSDGHKLYFADKLYPVYGGKLYNGAFTRDYFYWKNPSLVNALVPNNNRLDQKMLYESVARKVYLFCVGIDGCGIENSRVFKVQNTKWIAPYSYAKFDSGNGIIDQSITNCLIPFVMREPNSDLNKEDRKTYYGRSENGNNGKIAYYFKKFDIAPTLIKRYADDSSDLENIPDVWKDERLSEAEVVVQLKMSISPTDCREYFEYTTGTNTAKINTISLCTAVPYSDSPESGGTIYYKDIRPFTKFNFPNESLINTSKGIDITYYLYY